MYIQLSIYFNVVSFVRELTGMVAQRETGTWDKSLISRSCLDPQPERVICIQHPHLLPLCHKHLVLLLCFKVVYHHQFFKKSLLERVDGRLALCRSRATGRWTSWGVDQVVEGPCRSWIATTVAVRLGRVVLYGGRVPAHVGSSGLVRGPAAHPVPRVGRLGAESSVDAVGRCHVPHLAPVVPLRTPPARHDRRVRVVAALVDVRFVRFRLALVARVLAGRPYVVVRNVTGFSGLGEGVHPVVVFVEDFDALSLADGELFVAARGVVADGRHAEVGGSIARGPAEHLPLEGSVIGGVAGLVAALVARGVSRAAVVAGGAGAVLVVLDGAVSESVRVVVMMVRMVVRRLNEPMLAVPPLSLVVGRKGGRREGGRGACVANDRLLQLLGHGHVADFARDDLVEHLDAGRQHKVSLAVLPCSSRVVKERQL